MSTATSTIEYSPLRENTIYSRELAELLEPEIADLAAICHQVKVFSDHNQPITLNSGGVYRFFMETARCEEILDLLHSEADPEWFYFRKLVAMIKHSTQIFSSLTHMQHLDQQFPNLVEGDFALALRIMRKSFTKIYTSSCVSLLNQIYKLGILEQKKPLPPLFEKYFIPDFKELYRLKIPAREKSAQAPDKKATEKKRESILYFLSNLLHHCELLDHLPALLSTSSENRKAKLSQIGGEEAINTQCELFHSMITMYDTLDANDIIIQEEALKKILVCTKIVFRLLQTAGTLMRIYHRHLLFFQKHQYPLELHEDQLIAMLFDFFFLYANRYRLKIQQATRSAIQKFSVSRRVTVPIPSYRGFHVRPSTLIARIVMHYGSKVSMIIDGDSYNAAIPLDLFRANEKINAQKRREISKIVMTEKRSVQMAKKVRKNRVEDSAVMQNFFLELFNYLQSNQKIVMYEKIGIESLESPSKGENFLEYVQREIAYLMLTGKIDISSNLKVTFEGDSRVIADIVTLAKNGYGEDCVGNNIPLPKELSYLRR